MSSPLNSKQMMKKNCLSILCLAIASCAMAQASFVSDDRVAVFYPKHYDATMHQPSPIFVEEPTAFNPLPASWTLHPTFSERDGKSVATIHVGGQVDLYGTGEVTGTLRRNGKQISLWNIDTPAYSVDGGTHLYQSHPWVMGLRPTVPLSALSPTIHGGNASPPATTSSSRATDQPSASSSSSATRPSSSCRRWPT